MSNKEEYGVDLPSRQSSVGFRPATHGIPGETYHTLSHPQPQKWSLEEFRLGSYAGKEGSENYTVAPSPVAATTATTAPSLFSPSDALTQGSTPPTVPLGALPPSSLSKGYAPCQYVNHVGQEVVGQVMTHNPTRMTWSLEELRAGYAQGAKDPVSNLKNFFQSKVSKYLSLMAFLPPPPSAFNATTTSSKKSEYLLWLAKAKKINKITLIQFQKAKKKVLEADFSEVEELMKGERGKGGVGERRGVKEMLVFVRDYYRVGVIGGGEREKLKRYFFSREFSGFTGLDNFALFQTAFQKVLGRVCSPLPSPSSSPSPSPSPSPFALVSLLNKGGEGGGEGGRSCLGVVLQLLVGLKGRFQERELGEFKREAFKRATPQEKQKGSGDNITVVNFLQTVGLHSNKRHLSGLMEAQVLQKTNIPPPSPLLILPKDYLGKVLFIIAKMMRVGKLDLGDRNKLKKHYLQGANGTPTLTIQNDSALLNLFAEHFCSVTGYSYVAPPAVKGISTTPRKELLAAAQRMRRAGDGFVSYFLKKRAIELTASEEKSLTNSSFIFLVKDLPMFARTTALSLLRGIVPVPHPKAVQANACLLASLKYFPSTPTSGRIAVKTYALKNLNFPLGCNSLNHFASYFSDLFATSLGASPQTFSVACQKAFQSLSSPSPSTTSFAPTPTLGKPVSFSDVVSSPVHPLSPSVSSGEEVCGVAGRALLKASLFVLSESKRNFSDKARKTLKRAVLKVFFTLKLKNGSFENICEQIKATDPLIAKIVISSYKQSLSSLSPSTHPFLEGKKPFSPSSPSSSSSSSGRLVSCVGERKAGDRGQEMVMLMGFPGSGKSTICKGNFSDYERINQDTLLTKERCFDAAQEALQAGKSIVIDNTNGTPAVRKPFISLAKKRGVPVRAVHVAVDEKVAFQRNMERFQRGDAPMVPRIAYILYRKQFRPPTIPEGFYCVETYSNE